MPSDNESEESEEIIRKHFNDMDEILGKRESINPCHVLESSHVPDSESPEMSELERDILEKDALDEEMCRAAKKQRQGPAQNVSPPSECTVPSDGDESDNDQSLAFAESLFVKRKGKNKKPLASTPVPKRREADVEKSYQESAPLMQRKGCCCVERFWIKKRFWIHADQLLVITNQTRDVNIRYFKIMNNCIRSYTL